ncbi:MAG: hypothetical protein KDB22_18235 [Planctomycetales bacterium]|nr:hypothetical protein [Planctomycetales bacterium]
MSEIADVARALEPVARALESLGVRYYVGGSVASSYHGAVRSTMDVDIVCELEAEHVPAFLRNLGDDYYSSESAIREAIRRRTCFNLIHLPTSFKVDVFVSRRRPFDLQVITRAEVGMLDENIEFLAPIASAEDVIIIKLEWYRRGGEVSERQWDDVMRLVRLLGNSVDLVYLQQAAESVGVGDLLRRLLG